MNKTIIKAPSITMKELKSIFIEMTERNCNLKCKYCYMNISDKPVKDFMPYENIKKELEIIGKNRLDYIHLTGGEPMLHPDFNSILRLCLKYSNVVIHTNALNINDKKARFLRKVEEENNIGNEIIFMISIDSCDEKENDLLRGRGSFRKAIHAIQSLIKYDFNPILSIVNYKNTNEEELKNDFKSLCNSINFDTTDINFKIIPLLNKNINKEIECSKDDEEIYTECIKSRTLTINGIFACPLLCDDNRGKCGSNFNDFSNKIYLESSYCSQCIQIEKSLFSIDL